MVRKLACLTLVLAGLSGCASYEQGYADGYWRGAANQGVVKGKDGSVYAPAEDGYGDYYYREPAPEARDPYWAYSSLYSPLLWSYGYGPYWRHPAWSYGVSYRYYRPYSHWSIGYHGGYGWYPWSYGYGWGYGGWYDPWPYRRDWYGHHYPRPRPHPGPDHGPGPGPGTGGPGSGDPLERFGPIRRGGVRLPPVQPPLVDGGGAPPRLDDAGKRPGITGGRPMTRPPVDVDAGRNGRPFEVGDDQGTRTGRVIRGETYEADGGGTAPAPQRDAGIPLPSRGFRGMPETDRGGGRMQPPRMQAPRPEPQYQPRPQPRPEPRMDRPVDRGFRGMPQMDRDGPRMQQPRMEQPRMEQPRMEMPRMEQPRMAPPPAPRMAPPPPPPPPEPRAPAMQEE